MAGSYYIKLYIEILDDVKLFVLPDWAKWRFVQFMLVAKEHNRNGLLPPVTKMAWRLRLATDQVEEGLRALEEVGVVATTPDGWLVVNFAKRQAAISSTERSRQSRGLQRLGNDTLQERCTECNEDATLSSYSSSSSSSFSSSESNDSLTDSDSFNTLVESVSCIPSTPKEAEEHPAIQVFMNSTGGRLPGKKDYEVAISWVIQIARKYKLNEKNLPAYLNRWWTTWCSRKRADGKPYDPGNISWMEWAFNGEAPAERPIKTGRKNAGSIESVKRSLNLGE
jgi:hypothetical protein